MGWVYLDDSFPEHDKIIAAGGDATLLWVVGLAYCNRRLTEGRIPKSYVPQLTDRRKPMDLAAKLVKVGLWVEEDAHYRVHDYDKWNHSAAAKAKAKKAAETRWHAKGSDAQAMLKHQPKHMHEHVPDDMPEGMLGDASRAPGPHPPTTHVVSSSSSTSRLRPGDEEDWALTEARQKLANRPANLGPVNDPPKWLAAAAAKLRADNPEGPPAQPPSAPRLADFEPPDVERLSPDELVANLRSARGRAS